VYQVSPDGRQAAAASLEKMRRTQKGYGVMVPDQHSRRNVGLAEDDGLFLTDLETGERRLILSLADAARHIPELRSRSRAELAEWEIYGFHCKWCPDGHRLIFTIRRYLHENEDRFDAFARYYGGKGRPNYVRFDVLTLRPDGTDVHDAVPAVYWEKGGHHINFFPDGDRLSMNLGYFRNGGMDLVQVSYDGRDIGLITTAVEGSGHPTVHPDGRHILTDCYTHERWGREGTTPLRWIDLAAGTEREIVRLTTTPASQPDSALRVDPHPAWDRSWRWVAFNAVVGGVRRVLVADLAGLLAD
jgi:Tol biopolymer transport system component